MRKQDWFVVGLRLFGVWMLLGSVQELVTFAEVKGGWVAVHSTTPAAYFFHAAVDMLVGGLLLVGALPFAMIFDWNIAGFTGSAPESIPQPAAEQSTILTSSANTR